MVCFICSCVAVWRNGRVEVCPNEQGNRITPSYVAWASDGQRLIGDAALRAQISTQARHAVCARFNPADIAGQMVHLFEDVVRSDAR